MARKSSASMNVARVGVIQFAKGRAHRMRWVKASAIVEVEYVPDDWTDSRRKYRYASVTAVRGWVWEDIPDRLYRKLYAGFQRETGYRPRWLRESINSSLTARLTVGFGKASA